MTKRLAWPTVACVSGAAVTALVLSGAGGPARFVLALWFLLVCPGMSIVPALGIPAPATELLIGVTVGLLIDTLIATGLAAGGALTPIHALVALEAVCVLGAVLNVARDRRAPGATR